MSNALSQENILSKLESLPDWVYQDEKLTKHFKFPDFRAAIAFIMEIAFACESANHHPEMHQVYNRLTLSLTTHDAGNQVTQKDVDLAEAMEAIWKRHSK